MCVMWSLFISYCQTFKIKNMNIELNAITYQPNYRDTTEQIRIIQAYKAGAMEMQKEYEEKLRWIPVEERLPENQELVLVKTNRNCVSTAYLHGKISGFITYGEEAFVDFGSITHWRSIFL